VDWIKTYEMRLNIPVQCVRCLLGGASVLVDLVVWANTGYGLGTCAAHHEATARVVAELQADDDKQTAALFARHGAPVEPPAREAGEADGEQGPGEGTVYGRLPGSGRPGPSAADVMFGKLDR
jgi:hypothetical protein